MNNLYRLFIIACITVIMALGSVACSANAKETEAKPEVVYLTVPDRTEYYYVIADVAYTTETELGVLMPNGEVHDFVVDDVPEGEVREVCFRTENLDDYTEYEVVALR